MKAQELRTKTKDQLVDDLMGLRKEQFNLRFQGATGQLEGTARVREVRRTIARIKTVLKEQEIVQENKSREQVKRISKDKE